MEILLERATPRPIQVAGSKSKSGCNGCYPVATPRLELRSSSPGSRQLVESPRVAALLIAATAASACSDNIIPAVIGYVVVQCLRGPWILTLCPYSSVISAAICCSILLLDSPHSGSSPAISTRFPMYVSCNLIGDFVGALIKIFGNLAMRRPRGR